MPEERPDILATFAWLKKKLPQYQIEIRNYTIPGLEYAIRHGEVDFFLETAVSTGACMCRGCETSRR